ncbi:MAG TPA: hypothetical protein VLT62_12440 [Candidatus Methylomirabilis sp.]|nr:hypothetical protein [Candidatus Methylomirabilis sp.]
MTQDTGSPSELRAKIRLTKREIAHLWSGGILSLKVEASGIEADLELRCSEAEADRGTRILIKRVSAE